MSAAPDTGFVACIEGGMLEAQALLLFESVRAHGGPFRDAALYAYSPRPASPVSAGARRRLAALGVRHNEEELNRDCPRYGSANRVAAAAHAEAHTTHELLVVLDSDTLFLRPPLEFALASDVDAAVRPVDLKGMCTEGPGDPAEGYWRELAAVFGTDLDILPFTDTTVDRVRVRASYNGGLLVVRRALGICERWARGFFASVRRGLAPRTSIERFRAGAGWVEPAAGRLWGSNQAALALALWSTTRRVRELSPTYNYPLHLHDDLAPSRHLPALIHAHYHWLCEADSIARNPLLADPGALTPELRAWLEVRVPL